VRQTESVKPSHPAVRIAKPEHGVHGVHDLPSADLNVPIGQAATHTDPDAFVRSSCVPGQDVQLKLEGPEQPPHKELQPVHTPPLE
jgi:hypothetical protein